MAHERIVTTEATLADFIAYLSVKGTPMPVRGNEHFRAKWSGRIATIQVAKSEGWSLSPPAAEAWNAFQSAQPKVSTHRARRFKSISLRDGAVCFYCDRPLTPVAATVEHLVPRAHKGPNNLRNLALACEPCNKEAADLAVAQKVRLRETKRGVGAR